MKLCLKVNSLNTAHSLTVGFIHLSTAALISWKTAQRWTSNTLSFLRNLNRFRTFFLNLMPAFICLGEVSLKSVETRKIISKTCEIPESHSIGKIFPRACLLLQERISYFLICLIFRMLSSHVVTDLYLRIHI